MNDTPWHAASWRAMLNEGLPRLLADRLPLAGYGADTTGATARLTVCVGEPGRMAEAEYELAMPDRDGVFTVNGRQRVAPPRASSDDLASAEIRCVGEQFLEHVADRLGLAPHDTAWDEDTLRAVLALDDWANAFLCSAQVLDTTNWLSAHTHLRRVILPPGSRMFAPGHVGRTCPAETPENENIGRVLTVARGAEIRDGRLVVVDARPEAGLGPSASALPLLPHIDPARTLMACNLMRQWLVPPDPEPALVKTGLEPAVPEYWCGRNLLTAYVSMGIDTFEDSLTISESAARRLGYPGPLEAGDKLNNRNGNKGVVTRILPDAEMPRLEDGTAAELCMSPNSIYSRMTFGQLREAVLSWVARKRGVPFVSPPLAAIPAAQMAGLIAEAGLPPSGMQTLIDGRTGKAFEQPATVGWVYWGKLVQRAATAYFASADLTPRSQRWGETEFHALRLAGADATIACLFGLQSSDSPSSAGLAECVRSGAIAGVHGPSPVFTRLQRRLARTGIRAEAADGATRYRLGRPDGDVLRLAVPLPHPWLPECPVEEVGAAHGMPAFAELQRANARVERMLAASAPEALQQQAAEGLARSVAAFFDAMVGASTLRPAGRHDQNGRLAFSARAVATPGAGLAPDQVGIPEEMAWTLFEPMLSRTVGADAVRERSDAACTALDDLMSRIWVLVHRHPTTGPSSMLAFHPLRVPGRVIRIHPMACLTLNADFDGDVLGVILPVTDEAQREAGRTLTLAANIERDQGCRRCARPVYEAVFGPMVHQVRPTQDSRFGLARLCMTPAGLAEVEALAGVPVPLENGILTTAATCAVLDAVLAKHGATGVVDAASRLWYRGLGGARDLAPSLTPFPQAPCEPPVAPTTDDVDAWAAYQDEYSARMVAAYAARTGDTEPARVTLLSGARGTVRMWIQVVGVRGVVRTADDGLVAIRHSVSEGLTADETLTMFVGMRSGLTSGLAMWIDMHRELLSADLETGYGVLERALRSKRPGVVFARAAAAEETDPLDTPRARLLVGL